MKTGKGEKMKPSILFVAGNWDCNKGKMSGYMKKLSEALCFLFDPKEFFVYNGGNYSDLNEIIEQAKYVNIVFWFANVDNSLPKIRNIKEINPHVMLVTSKRNNNKYTFQELVSKSLEVKANLTCEIKTNEACFVRVFDPLGTVWSDFTKDIAETANAIYNRLSFLITVTRERTYCIDEKEISLPYSIPDSTIELFKSYGKIFTELVQPANNSERYLGNMSFRCTKGFPSMRIGDLIFVSKRNINKETITRDDFIATRLIQPIFSSGTMVGYYGSHKPSVDTPIQLRLYKKFPQIKYMLHSHVYIEGAIFTTRPIPCGGLEEVDEIIEAVSKLDDKNNFAINLVGHGSLICATDIGFFDVINFISRDMPELANNFKET